MLFSNWLFITLNSLFLFVGQHSWHLLVIRPVENYRNASHGSLYSHLPQEHIADIHHKDLSGVDQRSKNAWVTQCQGRWRCSSTSAGRWGSGRTLAGSSETAACRYKILHHTLLVDSWTRHWSTEEISWLLHCYKCWKRISLRGRTTRNNPARLGYHSENEHSKIVVWQ